MRSVEASKLKHIVGAITTVKADEPDGLFICSSSFEELSLLSYSTTVARRNKDCVSTIAPRLWTSSLLCHYIFPPLR